MFLQKIQDRARAPHLAKGQHNQEFDEKIFKEKVRK